MSVKYNYSDLRIAVVGAGNWGKNLIRVFHQLGALAAIVDIDGVKAQTLGQHYNVPHLSFSEMLASSHIDAVVIATPSITHNDLAFASLKAEKHVFVEKPLATLSEEIVFLQQLATKNKKVLMVGHLLQYHPAFIELKKIIHKKQLGNIYHISSCRYNFGKFPAEKSVLWDFAPHDVSMINALLGKMPNTITAIGANYLEHTQNDVAHIHLDYDKSHAHIAISWLHPYKEQKLIIVGEKGMALFEDSKDWENKLQLYPYPAEWHDGLPKPFPSKAESVLLTPVEPLLNECKHFLDCILGNNFPLTDAYEGLNVVKILEAAQISIANKEPVHLHKPSPTRIKEKTV